MFIGQEHITKQLDIILPHVKENHSGINLLLRGPSGYGKTDLARRICTYLNGNSYAESLGNNISVYENVWVTFIDEVHLCKEPETLYPLMDKEEFVFVLATNFDSSLPEALTNRCENFLFTGYSDEELITIFNNRFPYELPEEVVKHIIEIAGRCPRVIVRTYVNNLTMFFSSDKEILLRGDANEIINKIDSIHGIKSGLDANAQHYLTTLSGLGSRASLGLLASAMKLDSNSLRYGIEPILLYKGLIKITSRGRELC